ncbi:MAG: hypothetical protein ACT4PZ_19240 [Panacagrimonas sp.]
MLRRGGTATVFGAAPIGTKFEIAVLDVLMDRRLHGIFMGSNPFPVDMPRLVESYLHGRLHPDRLVSRRVPPESVDEGFAELKTGQTAHSVIRFQ